MRRKAIPPPMPIAQRRIKLINSSELEMGMQPIAVSIPWPPLQVGSVGGTPLPVGTQQKLPDRQSWLPIPLSVPVSQLALQVPPHEAQVFAMQVRRAALSQASRLLLNWPQ
jgi:hypothetical protein